MTIRKRLSPIQSRTWEVKISFCLLNGQNTCCNVTTQAVEVSFKEGVSCKKTPTNMQFPYREDPQHIVSPSNQTDMRSDVPNSTKRRSR